MQQNFNKHGGSKRVGGPGMRVPPTWSNFFSGNIWPNNRLVPPLRLLPSV